MDEGTRLGGATAIVCIGAIAIVGCNMLSGIDDYDAEGDACPGCDGAPRRDVDPNEPEGPPRKTPTSGAIEAMQAMAATCCPRCAFVAARSSARARPRSAARRATADPALRTARAVLVSARRATRAATAPRTARATSAAHSPAARAAAHARHATESSSARATTTARRISAASRPSPRRAHARACTLSSRGAS